MESIEITGGNPLTASEINMKGEPRFHLMQIRGESCHSLHMNRKDLPALIAFLQGFADRPVKRNKEVPDMPGIFFADKFEE